MPTVFPRSPVPSNGCFPSRRLVILLLLALSSSGLVASGSIPSGCAQTFSTTTNLSSDSARSNAPQIVVSSSNVFVVWVDNTTGSPSVYFKRSIDSGSTFGASRNLSESSLAANSPRIAVNGTLVHLIWQERTLGGTSSCSTEEIIYRRSVDGGNTWEPRKNLSQTSTQGAGDHRIAISVSNVYVSWRESSDGIFFARSVDRGATFEAKRRLVTEPSGLRTLQMVALVNRVHLVWGTEAGEVVYKRSSDYGVTWGASKNLSNNTGASTSPQIAVAAGKVYVVWEDDNPPGGREIFVRVSSDGGGTFLARKNLSGNVQDSYRPQIVATGKNVYVVWEDDTSTGDCTDTRRNCDVYFRGSLDGGLTWGSKRNLSASLQGSYNPRIGVVQSRVYVVWDERQTPSTNDIFLRISLDNSTTWGAKWNVSANTGFGYQETIGFSQTKLFIVWTDNTPGNWDVLLRRVSFP